MGSIEVEYRPAAEPPPESARTQRARFLSAFEADLTQLYARMMDEPVPARLIGILRAGLVSSRP